MTTTESAIAETAIPQESRPRRKAATVLPAVYMTLGSKGGVGKSMTALAAIDHLVTIGKPVLFVETDTDNPDVWRCLQRDPANAGGEFLDGVLLQAVSLDEKDGWMDLVNVIHDHPDHFVVINTAARMSSIIRKYGGILLESLPELGRKLIGLWLINRQRDGMDQLEAFLELFAGHTVHVVRNGLFGVESKFELYNTSELRAQIEATGGKSLTLPDLADRIADALYTERLAISDAMRKMPIGNRGELTRWRKEAHRALAPIFS